ncbi:MAG TPA: hypothetical protein VFP10_07545, partial [Candidatus Eisenbacteria bacterium]|nr:hypothetical protein [Candidatus Eisenbacteria bacterium]
STMLKRLLLLVAFHAAFARTASADSVSPNPWYQQVATASFVGVVQCEVAGVVAAKYRVLESWKGPPVGTILTIDQQFRTYGAYSPFAVCGEKYLACVYSSTYLSLRPFDITRLASVASPYWWKDAEAEYYTHTLPYLTRLPVERSDDLSVFGIWGKKASFQAYRESVLTYMSMPAAAQEDKALRPFVKSILRVYPQYEPDRDTRVAMEELAVRVDSLGLDSLVNAIVTLQLDHPKGRMGYPETMLIAFGGGRTLAALRSPRGLEAFPGDTLNSRHPVRRVADREIPKRADWNVRVPAYSESDRDAHRSVFASPWGSRFLEAFAWLTEHDPETVMRWFEQ